MQAVKFKNLFLLSQVEKRALHVPLHPQKLLIQGANGFGKSVIMKSLYEALGATPNKIDARWKNANVSSCLEFEFRDATWFSVKAHGVFSLFDDKGNRQFWGQRLVKDWGPKLADFFGFKLEMVDKGGETLTPPPAYLFAPFYIDQDGSWDKPWVSFRQDFYLPQSASTLADYHSGIRPDGYYTAKAELTKEKIVLFSLETAVETLRQAMTQIKEIEGTTPTYDLKEFASECDDLVAESERLLVLQAEHRRTVSDVHEEVHLVRAEADLVNNALREMRGEFELASSLPRQVECPTCGHEYQNSLAERFALIEDEGVLSEALIEAQSKLERLVEKELAERGKLDTIVASLGRIENILETQKQSLSLNDVLIAAGKTEAAKLLRASLNEKIVAADASRKITESLRASMIEFSDRIRTSEIKKFYRARLSMYSQKLDVHLDDPERQSIESISVARGSEGPRALLAYYYAFLHTKTNFTTSVRFPVVIDSPNQQGQDTVHLPQMLKFIFDHVPDDVQTIVATEDASELKLEGVTIATYGEAKRQILREKEFDQVRAIFDPFFQKILAME
ncbi:hypothetical protein D2N39_22100 [Gemmobacter lutimaris]|jgi:hypothetical protein|uniref:Rad50/SbcC-type AAA domain-containing protein n=1 Tax=Gemmobacter lutimaris TaxID=2306023 RepID=A0A398BJ23_9RHOB|nr:hypothetical protein [Gemmobacter lutimaris]RID89654.1 hypothetical protein D2N39_22100 [Gemmobacter lutimaris]